MKVKVIFDKEKIDNRFQSGWGLSYLIDEHVLFDTGERGSFLLHNMEVLHIQLNSIKSIVISHNLWDHDGGVKDLIEMNPHLKLFVCPEDTEKRKQNCLFNKDDINFRQTNIVSIDRFQKIEENIYTTGPLKAVDNQGVNFEQSLVVKTDRGISIFCGCSRPGIGAVLQHVKTCFPDEEIYCLVGGLHLMYMDRRSVDYIVEEICKFGVQRVAPSHCTGYDAIQRLNERYKDNLIDMKVGVEFDV